MKRALDLLASVSGILVLAPIGVVVAIVIWLQDWRNPLYVAPRVGQHGRHFRMIKFRTMVINADRVGGASTAADDRRVTWIGALLRRFKLDELPQLLNVAAGQMSLVGPRPQVPGEVEKYTDFERGLLAVRPGITDYSSIVFADEGEILAGAPDPDARYDELIRPWKSRLGLFYVETRTVGVDLALVGLTVLSALDRPAALERVSALLRRHGAPTPLWTVARRAPDWTREVLPAPDSVRGLP